MSWFEARAYGPFDRAKGMRFPPTMAARRVFTRTTVSATLSCVKEPVSGVTHATAAADPDEPRIDGRAARWTEHRATRREELIDAAITAINELGSDVGMDQIAAAASTSKPVIYRYFTDKDELYRAVGSRVVRQIVVTLLGVRDDPDPQALLRASIDAYLQLLEDNPQLFRFVTQNRVFNEARVGQPAPAEFSHAIVDVLTAALGEQLRTIGLDPAAAQPWGEAAVGFIRAASLWWLDHPQAMTRPQLTDYLAALLWGGGAGVYQSAGREVDARPAPGIFPRARSGDDATRPVPRRGDDREHRHHHRHGPTPRSSARCSTGGGPTCASARAGWPRTRASPSSSARTPSSSGPGSSSAIHALAAAGYSKLGFPTAYGGSNDVGGSITGFEMLAMGDLSLLVKVGVQWGLFGGAILHLGTGATTTRTSPTSSPPSCSAASR